MLLAKIQHINLKVIYNTSTTNARGAKKVGKKILIYSSKKWNESNNVFEYESITSLKHQLSLAKQTTGKPCVAPPHQQSSHSVNIQKRHHQDIYSPPGLHLKSNPKKSNYKKFIYNMISN